MVATGVLAGVLGVGTALGNGGLHLSSPGLPLHNTILEAPRFAFAPEEYMVVGPAVLVTAESVPCDDPCTTDPFWTNASFYRGTIVILDIGEVSDCSVARYSRALGQMGAAAVAVYARHLAMLPATRPGSLARMHLPGDELAVGTLPTVDVTQHASVGLYSALQSGASVKATLTPSRNPWDDIWRGPWSRAVVAIVAVPAIIVIELSATRFVTFARAYRQPLRRPSIVEAMLLLEMAEMVLRLVHVSADPFLGNGEFRGDYALIIYALPTAVGSLAVAFFLVYFVAAASNLGVASLRLSWHTWGFSVLYTVATLVAFDQAILSTAMLLPVGMSAVTEGNLLYGFVGKALMAAVAFPSAILLGAAHTLHRVTTFWGDEEDTSLRPRLSRAMFRSMCFALSATVLGVFSLLGFAPGLRVGAVVLQHLSWVAASYVRADAFVPANREVLIGPVQRSLVVGGYLAGLVGASVAKAALAVARRMSRRLPRTRLLPWRSPGRGTRAQLSSEQGREVAAVVDVGHVVLQYHLDGVPQSGAADEDEDDVVGYSDDGEEVIGGGSQDDAGSEGFPSSSSCAATDDGEAVVPTPPPNTRTRAPATLQAPHAAHVSPLTLGVTVGFMERFRKEHAILPQATGYDVGELVARLTQSLQRSVCVHMAGGRDAAILPGAHNPSERETGPGHPEVASATVFVVYAHASRFYHLVDAATEFLAMHRLPADTTYFWVDLFTVNQHAVHLDLPLLPTIIASVGRTMVMMDPWFKPVALSRAWCLYEVLCAITSNSKLNLSMSKHQREAFHRELMRRKKASECFERVWVFDVRGAVDSGRPDHHRLLEMVGHSSSVEDFNDMVNTAIRKALVDFSWSLR